MKKRILIVLSVLALVSASIFGTLAYLTDTDTATNTFTVGQVGLKLDEADVKTDGTYETNHDSRVTANEYHLLPGHTYIKDPTVTVDKGSEDAYVRMLVTVERIDQLKAALPRYKTVDDQQVEIEANQKYYGEDGVFLLQMLCGGWDPAVWVYEDYNESADGKNGTYEFRYFEKVTKNKDKATVLDDLFETITVPGEVDNAGIKLLGDVTIKVVAHAIQADGFVASGDKSAADVAWEAFDDQN